MPRYFKKSEFACPCGCGKDDIDTGLVDKLDKARELAGVPFGVTSGCRCNNYNQELKRRGYKVSEDSAHMTGFAVDISATGANRNRIIWALCRVFERVGIGADFVHVDVDPDKPTPAVWGY